MMYSLKHCYMQHMRCCRLHINYFDYNNYKDNYLYIGHYIGVGFINNLYTNLKLIQHMSSMNYCNLDTFLIKSLAKYYQHFVNNLINNIHYHLKIIHLNIFNNFMDLINYIPNMFNHKFNIKMLNYQHKIRLDNFVSKCY